MFSSMNEREKSINDSRCDKHVWFLMQKIRINLENIFFRHLFPRAAENTEICSYVCQNNWNFLNSIYRAYVGVCVCVCMCESNMLECDLISWWDGDTLLDSNWKRNSMARDTQLRHVISVWCWSQTTLTFASVLYDFRSLYFYLCTKRNDC